MILTPTVVGNLENIQLALETSNAVLIQGEIGCGKSASVLHLAERRGARETMIQVNVDDTFDSKDLLGKFSATETPGTFEWVPGPLTVAVQNGYWVLMEDIDLASFDVFSVLLSLLENATLFIPDKNRFLRAHDGFKLIATQQLYSSGAALLTRKSNAVPYAELWGTVIMESLSAAEMCTIIHSTHGNVPVSVVQCLATLTSPTTGGSLVGLQNLLRWSKRVSRRLPSTPCNDNADGKGAPAFISSRVREAMVKEAFDCLVAKYPPGNERAAVLKLVAEACGVPINVAEPLVLECRPQESLAAGTYSVGRVQIPLISTVAGLARESRVAFAPTTHAMSLLERLAAAVESREHVLLTGETGVGKTFIVQYLADQLGQTLIVHNLNQQTDSSDFMGGWKPLDVGVTVRELYDQFVELFAACFNAEKNAQFLSVLQRSVADRKWDRALRQVIKGCGSFKMKSATAECDSTVQRQWAELEQKASELLDTVERTKTNFAFHYEEGSLVKAWREGHWILLDELNLASTEVLERVSSVLGDVDRLFLTDKDSSEPVMRHPNFHVFANMNPPTDVGKKDLPPSLRSRFVECYVSEPFNRNDISIVVREYIGFLTADSKVDEITDFFLDCVNNAKTKLCALDGESKPPSFSLRTLTRALSYVRRATPLYGFTIALFDGLLLGFATPLQRQFHAVVEQLVVKNIFRGRRPNSPTLPAVPTDGSYVAYEHMWIPAGTEAPYCDEAFILTDSVKGHLTNLGRAVFASRPVLLEGPTSSGKSSMVKYLAELTGNRFVRINNHDSTEVQEYLGHYVTDEFGKLRYVDGILVNAVRHGYWVVLDELNLAPTDVLEALNRLLDDNCELFVPDTQETIKPHPQLRIFATQNPAGVYGGRKMLSRAFRNRFLEITVDEIPTAEISTILCRRYALPQSFAERMVEVMTALQIRRQNSQIFAGRHGFITPRDLFRWAERRPETYQQLAEHGFLLLGERCRKPSERQVVRDVLESVTKTELDEKAIYHPSHWPYVQQYFSQIESGVIDEFKIVWTESMQRLFTIVGVCLEHKEPVLLVGETGSSKTTVCQLWAALLGIPLHILNCHQHTEAADFLGSLRPSPPERRDEALFEWRNGPLVQSMLDGDMFVLDEVSLTEDSVLERLNSVLEPSRSVTLAEKSSADCIVAHERFLVMATMNPGGDFGKKELSPALRNRFTEIYVRPTTDVAEVGMILSRRLEAELAPWAARMAAVLCRVSQSTATSGAPQHISIRDIISWVSFMNAAHGRCPPEIAFLQGLDAVILDGIGVGSGQSEALCAVLRNGCTSQAVQEVSQSGYAAIDHKSLFATPFWEVCDGMAEPELPASMQGRFFFGAPATRRNLSKLMRASLVKKAVLLEGSPGVGKTSIVEALGCALARPVVRINLSEQTDIMDLFGTYLPSQGDDDAAAEDEDEESPAAAAAAESAEEEEQQQQQQQQQRPAHKERDRTTGPQFAWSDGVLLRALKEGSWVILDELNLASQSVLEGLNALLDHRSTVFIPELNEEFHAHPDFRVFACQNPLLEGGGRKGLPRSFLNRFIKVHVEAFEVSDLIVIAQAVCPDIAEATLRRMVDFVGRLQHDTMVRRAYGLRGSPWEFNLRDVLRWAKLLQSYEARERPTAFADMLFFQRMRTDEDAARCRLTLESCFTKTEVERDVGDGCDSDFLIRDGAVYFARERLVLREAAVVSAADAQQLSSLLLLPSQAHLVRSLLVCVEQNQFALLVGPSGAGKTFALRTAAALAGAKLTTFSMTASCDTVDLLGGFDQVEGKQGEFEWRDSLVLEAMVQGHWLVLDNVNYCNASVLDRLNPLVEPNGVLSVNEQGVVKDEVRVVRPHPRFRLFATLNPRYGEISRAMRNRAVELYVAPVAIPSPESLALGLHASVEAQGQRASSTSPDAVCAKASLVGDVPQQGLPPAHLLSRLVRYHHTFVSVGFHADTQHAGSAQLSDALSAGAPSLFTLLRTSRLLLPSSRTSDLERLILHRYIRNRSGHWASFKSELLELLRRVMDGDAGEGEGATGDSEAADVLRALQLEDGDVRRGAGRAAGDEAAVSAADSVAEALVQRRVRRAALALQGHLSKSAGAALVDVKAEEAKPPLSTTAARDHRLEDLLLCFVLDQCSDSVPVDAVTEARRSWLAQHLPADVAQRALPVVRTDLCAPAMLEGLYVRANLLLGPNAGALTALWSSRTQVASSALVNSAVAQLCEALQAVLAGHHATATPPAVSQRLLRLAAPFARLVVQHGDEDHGVHTDNYIPLVTFTALLCRAAAKVDPPTQHAAALAHAGARFLDALQQHLDLPFPLLGGAAVLHHYAPAPHITTAEERRVLQAWSTAAHTASTRLSSAPTATDCTALLHRLWEAAAFREGFACLQQLLFLRTTSATHAQQAAGAPAPTLHHHLLPAVQARMSAFADTFTTRLPLFTELELALWRGVQELSPARPVDMAAALATLTPLLVSRFTSRYGVTGTRHLFAGAWAAAAADCVRYGAQVPVMDIGRADNARLRALAGLTTFLQTCPLAPASPLEEWAANSQRELVGVLCVCFPSLASCAPPLPPPSRASAASQARLAFFGEAEAVVAGTAPTPSPALERHRALAAALLHRLRGGDDDDTRDGSDSMAAVTLLWVLKCRLLLPQSPVDPMYRRECKRAVATAELELLGRLDGAFAWAEQLAMRHHSPQRDILAALRVQEKASLQRARRKFVARPDDTGMRYATLVRRLYQVCATLLSDARVLGLFEVPTTAAGALDAAAAADILAGREAWSDLVYEQVMELLAEYGGYEDATVNFAEAALLAAMAARASCSTDARLLAAAATAAPDAAASPSRTLFHRTDTLRLLQFPSPLVSALPMPPLQHTSAMLRHRVVYLDSCLSLLACTAPQGVRRAFVEDVFAQYRSLFLQVEEWEAQERRADELAVLYKEKATVIEGDDEKLLRKLKELFPSYEAEFSVDALEEDAVGASGQTKAEEQLEGRRAKFARILFKERDGVYLRHLVEVHRTFYHRLISSRLAEAAAATAPTSPVLLTAFQHRFDVLAAELHTRPAPPPPPSFSSLSPSTQFGDGGGAVCGIAAGEEQLLLNGFAARASLLRAEMRGAAVSLEERRETGFNIFQDTDVYEVSRFSTPLQALLDAVQRLAEQFPDTPSLQRCLRIGCKIATLPAMTTPLMKVMAGCEVLLRECYEWERNASHEVSLMQHMTELSSFVLRWRRLELHCWSHVFQAKRAELELQAAQQWAVLYDLLLLDGDGGAESEGDDGDDGERDTQSPLLRRCGAAFRHASQFMWSATLGDYSVRLRLLQGFGFQLLAVDGPQAPLANTVLHACDFFAQFEPLVQQRCSAAVQPIEEDIAEFAKIMRWEDANYYAVRATAEKSHLKMARVLGSLEEALRTPVLAVITADEQRCEDDVSLGFTLPPATTDANADSRRRQKKGKAAPDAGARQGGKRHRNGKILLAADAAASADAASPPLLLQQQLSGNAGLAEAHTFLRGAAAEMIESVTALQQPKTPQQMKVRALKMLFDRLTEAGVPHTHVGQVGAWEVLFATTEAMLGCAETHRDDESAAVARLGAAAAEHYRFARWLQRLREVERRPHHDLSAAQAKRGTGTTESLFASAVHATETLCGLFHLHEQLHVVETAVQHSSTSSDDETAGHGMARELLDDVVEVACLVQSVCGGLAWMVQQPQMVASGAAEANTLVQELAGTSRDLWAVCAAHEPLRRSAAPVLPPGVSAAVFDVLQRAREVASRVRSCPAASVAAAAVPLVDAITRVLDRHERTASDVKRRRTEQPPPPPPWPQSLCRTLEEVSAAVRPALENGGAPAPSEGPKAEVSEHSDAESDAEAPAPETGVYARYALHGEAVHGAVQRLVPALEQLLSAVGSAEDGDSSAVATSPAPSPRACVLTVSERADLLARLSACRREVQQARDAWSTVLEAHCSFGVVVARLFTVLLKKGFCKAEEEDQDGDGDGDGDGGEQKSGTGMDDGEGEKDVTDQIDNEDQLMNMKDKEEQPEEQEREDKGDDEEDKAADVETDFNGQKEQRSESDGDGDEEGEESDKEMGDVEEGTEQERKKSKKDAGDVDDMNEDAGDAAQEVPEDDMAEGDEQQDENDETGGFADKAEEIRDADKAEEEERSGEHDIVGDDAKSEMDEGGDDDDGDDSGDSVERSDADGEEREESARDDALPTDADEEPEEGEDGSEDHVDSDAATDAERSEAGEEDARRQDSGSDAGDATDVEDASDGPDENVFEGGQQDDREGDEATENRDKDKSKDKSDAARQEHAANEEEQPGTEQEEDDSGNNWKQQQQQNDQAQRRDNTEQTRSQHNPYRAVKEAMQRHQRQMQQLNLSKHVKVTDEKERDRATEKPPKPDEAEVEEFDWDEEGDREGVAAVDQSEAKPTEADANEEEQDQHSDDDVGDKADAEDADDDAAEPQQDARRRRRQGKEDGATELEEEEESADADGKRTKKKKSSRKVRTTARDEDASASEEDEKDDRDERKDEQAVALEASAKLERGRQLWLEQETAVQGLSQQLCEQLRLILAPTLADKLQGDYKTGKRLNMKRIIPYIASQFKKDRIWLRRTKPNKRTYQILVALDDSLSMQCNNAGVLSCRAVALIAKALQQLEVGEFGVACFGKETHVVHPLEEPFLADSGPRLFSEITFEQKSTDMKLFLETTLGYLDDARDRMRGQTRSTTQQLQQIMFIISDGQITENRADLRQLMARAEENHQMVVFVLLDIKAAEGGDSTATAAAAGAGAGAGAAAVPTAAGAATPLTAKMLQGLSTAERLRRLKADREARLQRVQSNSILDMQIVEFQAGRVVRRPYMEDFPFPYYLIIRDIQNLPEIIADAMRQWFELLNAGA
ncbi:Midasin [Novymonas esmeraldas]|uniref:Midasin n=1 Tax=Novymonas esmeraldas TaxID=1808958 RepID=A0AAW0F9R8_9TRYP